MSEKKSQKKPWRTIILSEETGRFTREQIDNAVAAVLARQEKAARRKGGTRRSGRTHDDAARKDGSGKAAA